MSWGDFLVLFWSHFCRLIQLKKKKKPLRYYLTQILSSNKIFKWEHKVQTSEIQDGKFTLILPWNFLPLRSLPQHKYACVKYFFSIFYTSNLLPRVPNLFFFPLHNLSWSVHVDLAPSLHDSILAYRCDVLFITLSFQVMPQCISLSQVLLLKGYTHLKFGQVLLNFPSRWCFSMKQETYSPPPVELY